MTYLSNKQPTLSSCLKRELFWDPILFGNQLFYDTGMSGFTNVTCVWDYLIHNNYV